MKYLKYFIFLFVFVVGISLLMTYLMESSTPPFVLDKLEKLRSDKVLMDSIGGFSKYEYTYNENDYKYGDTLKYSIVIKGGKRELIYKGIHFKKSESQWQIFDESLLIE